MRVPSGAAKARLLDAVERAAKVLGRSAARFVGLSDARFRQWKKREPACALDDSPPVSAHLPRTPHARRARRELVAELAKSALR